MFKRGVVWALLAAAVGQSQTIPLRQYRQADGLNNLSILKLFQDGRGYLWAGTENGLFRHDGQRFREFGPERGEPSGPVNGIAESGRRVWVLYGSSICSFMGEGLRCQALPEAVDPNLRQTVTASIDDLFVAGHEAIYEMSGKGLASLPFGVPSTGRVWSIHFQPSRGLWAAQGEGIHFLEDGQWRTVEAPADHYVAIASAPDGSVYARGAARIVRLAPHSAKFEVIDAGPHLMFARAVLQTDAQGRVFVPCREELRTWDGHEWRSIGPIQGLPADLISDVLVDREGSLWLGYFDGGLYRRLGGPLEFQNFTASTGLKTANARALLATNDRTWVASRNGVALARREGSIWKWFEVEGLRGQPVWSLSPLRAGGLLAASQGGLFQVFDSGAYRLRWRPRDPNRSQWVVNAFEDSHGRIWAGTPDALYGFEAGAFEPLEITPLLGAPTRVWQTVESGTDIWIATDRGLFRFDSKSHVSHYTTQDGLRDASILCLAPAAGGGVWFSYQNPHGIGRATLEGGALHVEHFGIAEGRSAEGGHALAVDRQSRLWVSHDRGVDVLENNQWRHFGEQDGLVWDETNARALAIGPDGAVWIGTSNGISRITPPAVLATSPAPDTVFTSLRLSNRPVSVSDSPVVDHLQNSLMVKLGALTFLRESEQEFRYRLNGVTDGWVITTDATLPFYALPPGQYKLEVQARSNGPEWGAPTSFTFEIRPPWWQTWWFILLSAAAAALAATTLVFRLNRRQRETQLLLEQAVATRTLELTEEKQRAEEASQHKSIFLANMSHELRTPLNGVIGLTNVVLGTPLDPPQRANLEAVRDSGTSLLGLLSDILDFSKIEAGHMEVSPVVFETREFFENACRIFRFNSEAKGLEFHATVAPEVPGWIRADDLRLRQVLLNLAANALKFTERGAIRISLEVAQASPLRLKLTVADTGVGIAPDKQARIFEAFRQADETVARDHGGTGLGLAICTRLAALMGGDIQLKSQPGQGSTFTFTFAAETVEAPQEASPDPAGGRSLPALRLLIAEDTRVNQMLIRQLLEREGHSVVMASNGREAVEHWRSGAFDAIFMDVSMPDMDGLEACRLIRSEEQGNHPIPIIALTANALEEDRQRCIASGMDGFLEKPLDNRKLQETLVRLTGVQGRLTFIQPL